MNFKLIFHPKSTRKSDLEIGTLETALENKIF